MNRLYFVLVVATSPLLIAQAAQPRALHGRLLNASTTPARPVGAASVRLPYAGEETTTDSQGEFFLPLPISVHSGDSVTIELRASQGGKALLFFQPLDGEVRVPADLKEIVRIEVLPEGSLRFQSDQTIRAMLALARAQGQLDLEYFIQDWATQHGLGSINMVDRVKLWAEQTRATAATSQGDKALARDSTLALYAASPPVVDRAAAAYREANAIHDLLQNYEAYVAYENKEAYFNPRKDEPLLSENDMEVRLRVLEGLQLYVKSLCAMASVTNSPELDSTSAEVGGELKSPVNSLVPSVSKVLSTAIDGPDAPSPAVLSPKIQNATAVSLDSLGSFLMSRKVSNELPKEVEAMDPHILTLATLLNSDLRVVESVTVRDSDRAMDLQKQRILEAERPNSSATPSEMFAETTKLVDLSRKQKAAAEKLDSLGAAIRAFELAHHQLAACARSNNPQLLMEKLLDLASAAKEVGHHYSVLPTQ